MWWSFQPIRSTMWTRIRRRTGQSPSKQTLLRKHIFIHSFSKSAVMPTQRLRHFRHNTRSFSLTYLKIVLLTNKRPYRPVVVEMAHLVRQTLHVIRLQHCRVVDHIVVSRRHSSLAHRLRHEEKVVPSQAAHVQNNLIPTQEEELRFREGAHPL